jgi:AcrR family transcriptional regulator
MRLEPLTRKSGRPRSSQSHQAILQAALALFAQEGLAGLSMEAIAEQAGVGKTTIYRRWPSKEDVIKEALTQFREEQPLPDTGALRGDLLAVTQQAQDLFRRYPLMARLTAMLIAEIKARPEIYQAFYEKLIAPRRAQFHEMVERAKVRGEIRPELDSNFIVSLIFIALVYGDFLGELIDPAAGQGDRAEAAVDVLMRGIGTNH